MLANFAMQSEDRYLGTVVEVMPIGEIETLEELSRWHRGWPNAELTGNDDEWETWGEKTKAAAMHDGTLSGGNGRFSGEYCNWLCAGSR